MQLRSCAYLVLAATLFGCATKVATPDGDIDITVSEGEQGCQGCFNIKYITSRLLSDKLYAIKNENGLNTGQRISAGISIGISNVHGYMATGGRNMDSSNLRYGIAVTGSESHFMHGIYDHDAAHPYRFFIQIHHNSSFNSQAVHLVVDGAISAPIPPTEFAGHSSNRSCFSTGCVWDEDYAIPYDLIQHDIDANQPLVVFVGDQVQLPSPSQDGFSRSYRTINQGVELTVPSAVIKRFVWAAKKQISGT